MPISTHPRMSIGPLTTIGVVGLNYWGPNLVRNFNDIADLTWLCDLDEGQLQTIGARYPSVRTTSSGPDALRACQAGA